MINKIFTTIVCTINQLYFLQLTALNLCKSDIKSTIGKLFFFFLNVIGNHPRKYKQSSLLLLF